MHCSLFSPQMGPAAKVTSVSPRGGCSMILCAYASRGAHDRENRERVLRGLREALRGTDIEDRTVRFKPDAYSVLSIYAGNKWGIRPSTFSATLWGGDGAKGKGKGEGGAEGKGKGEGREGGAG